ncbi:MAG: hypothetical protein JNM34_06575 [Chthonomonadaceae bacterium]|jgi:ribosomal protein L21E|nr:hypothetical protein [Chthonomonadaceae bacterium]
MGKFKEGDKVKVTTRQVSEQDRKVHGLYEHMLGLTGTVENLYGNQEVSVKVDLDCLPKIPADVHKLATTSMRTRFLNDASEEAKKSLTKEELEFVPHYMLLVRPDDLEKA